MGVIKTLEHELRRLARDRKTLRDRRTLCEHAREVRVFPYGRKIDAAVMKAIGIDQPRDQAKWKVVAIDGMGRKQRPARLELDRPKTVELDRRLAVGEWRVWKLRGGMKTERRARMA